MSGGSVNNFRAVSDQLSALLGAKANVSTTEVLTSDGLNKRLVFTIARGPEISVAHIQRTLGQVPIIQEEYAGLKPNADGNELVAIANRAKDRHPTNARDSLEGEGIRGWNFHNKVMGFTNGTEIQLNFRDSNQGDAFTDDRPQIKNNVAGRQEAIRQALITYIRDFAQKTPPYSEHLSDLEERLAGLKFEFKVAEHDRRFLMQVTLPTGKDAENDNLMMNPQVSNIVETCFLCAGENWQEIFPCLASPEMMEKRLRSLAGGGKNEAITAEINQFLDTHCFKAPGLSPEFNIQQTPDSYIVSLGLDDPNKIMGRYLTAEKLCADITAYASAQGVSVQQPVVAGDRKAIGPATATVLSRELAGVGATVRS